MVTISPLKEKKDIINCWLYFHYYTWSKRLWEYYVSSWYTRLRQVKAWISVIMKTSFVINWKYTQTFMVIIERYMHITPPPPKKPKQNKTRYFLFSYINRWSVNNLKKKIFSLAHFNLIFFCLCVRTGLSFDFSVGKSVFSFYSDSLVAIVLDYDIVVSEFELQSRYYHHIRTNTIGKGMNSIIPQAVG